MIDYDICHKNENDKWYLKCVSIWCYDNIGQPNKPEQSEQQLTGKKLA